MQVATLLQRSTPEAEGIASGAIGRFVDAVERDVNSLHSFMLLRHGKVVAEAWWKPYAPELPHMMFSLSKSFTSTAIGMLVDEGKLSVEDTVLSLFPDHAPSEPSDHLKAMRVKHLLTMNTGHATDTTPNVFRQQDQEWTRAFLSLPVEHEPSTFFVYNTGATYMLSAIVQRKTGQRLLEYLRPRLFEPLGIEHATWDQSPQGIDQGGTGLHIRTEDIARFGQLYLQNGKWEGRQLVSAAWVKAATSAQTPNGPNQNPDWEQGYGYQFWRCRHDGYRGDGAFGQFCVVLPEHDVVLAATSGLSNMQKVLDAVWAHLLPAFGPPMAANAQGVQALQAQLATRGLKIVMGVATSPIAAKVSGVEYDVPPGETGISKVRFEFGPETSVLYITNNYGVQRITSGYGQWSFSDAHVLRTPEKLASSGAWLDSRTYVAEHIAYETPFVRRVTFSFGEDGRTVTIATEQNVAFTGGMPAFPTLVATRT